MVGSLCTSPSENKLHWENQPMTEEMEYMYKAYPEAGIILPSFGEVRILDTAMGAIKEELTYEFDSNVEGWRIRKIESANHDRGTGRKLPLDPL